MLTDLCYVTQLMSYQSAQLKYFLYFLDISNKMAVFQSFKCLSSILRLHFVLWNPQAAHRAL